MLEYGKENGIMVYYYVFQHIVPIVSNRVQPLDVGFFAPLQTFYNMEIEKLMRDNLGRTVTHFQVTKLFYIAYLKAATLLSAISSFKKSGIHAFNPDLFEDWEFAGREITNEEQPQSEIEDETQHET